VEPRIIGWKRPPRSSSPTIFPTPPYLLNIPKQQGLAGNRAVCGLAVEVKSRPLSKFFICYEVL